MVPSMKEVFALKITLELGRVHAEIKFLFVVTTCICKCITVSIIKTVVHF